MEASSIVPVLNMELLSVLSFTAIVTTFGVFLCGIPICQQIAQKGSTDGITAAPFVLGTVGSFFWLRYGFLKNDGSIKIINGLGLFLQTSYLVFYYVYCRSKTFISRLALLVVALCGSMLVYINFYSLVPDVALNHLGLMCLTLNIFGYGAPLAGLRDVLRIRSTENLPLPLCMGNLLVAIQWFWYGSLTEDVYIKIPNFFGIILAIIQLSLFLIYPRRRVHNF